MKQEAEVIEGSSEETWSDRARPVVPRITFVSGGMGGIGSAICRRFAQSGHTVVAGCLPGYDRKERAADAVVALLDERGRRDRVLVSSFQLSTVDRVRASSGSIATGLLTVTRASAALMDQIAERGHHALHPGRRAMGRRRAEQVVAHARERGLQVNVWTVNTPATLVRLRDAGVDGLITDVPDVARAVLGLS